LKTKVNEAAVSVGRKANLVIYIAKFTALLSCGNNIHQLQPALGA
jgi:hypothetical protein